MNRSSQKSRLSRQHQSLLSRLNQLWLRLVSPLLWLHPDRPKDDPFSTTDSRAPSVTHHHTETAFLKSRQESARTETRLPGVSPLARLIWEPSLSSPTTMSELLPESGGTVTLRYVTRTTKGDNIVFRAQRSGDFANAEIPPTTDSDSGAAGAHISTPAPENFRSPT